MVRQKVSEVRVAKLGAELREMGAESQRHGEHETPHQTRGDSRILRTEFELRAEKSNRLA